MSPKLLVFFLVLGIVALTVQAGGGNDKGDSSKPKEKSNESKSDHSKSHESKSGESKSNSKSSESKSGESKSNSKSSESKSSESKSQEDCEEPPVKPPHPPQKCGRNEEWTNCGTACPPTCDRPKPEVCILKCVVGCQCKKGLLRDKWGKCVEAAHCSK